MIYDVIIVGGGPAGSACATVLSRAGLNVLVCERTTLPRAKICGDCVNPKTWELFSLLEISENVRALPLNLLTKISVSNSRRDSVTMDLSDSSERPFFAVSRALLDQIFLRQAQASGADVRQEAHVGAVDWDELWHVQITQGRDENFAVPSGRVLVGADGRNSLVGTAFAKQTTGWRRTARVGVQWLARAQPLPQTVAMFLFEMGYAGVVNLDDDCSNIAMTTTPETAQFACTDFETFLAATLLSNPVARHMLKDITPLGDITTAYPVNPVRRAVLPGAVFLAGDARRTLEPFTGEGVCFALNDGIRTAVEVLRFFGQESALRIPYRSSSWWPNYLFSQILRSDRLSESAVAIAARFPDLLPWVLKTVF